MIKKRKSIKKKKSLKHVKKRITTFLVTVGIISTASILVYGVWAMRDIYKPIATFAAEEQTEVYIEDTQFAFFTTNVDSNNFIGDARLIAVDKDDNTVKELVLPENTSIHLPYGLNNFKLKSLYKIALMEKPNNPLSLVKQTLTDYFGVSTKNIYVLFNNDSNTPVHQWLTNPITMFRLAFDADWTTKNLTGNTSRWDMLSLSRTIQAIPDESKTSISILENEIGVIKKDVDNTDTIITDQNKLDAYVKKAFENKDLVTEKANITIENATATQGLARSVSRIITNMGGVVIDLHNSETSISETKIIVSDKKWLQSVTLQKIVKSLPYSKIETVTTTESKSDITVVLGQDYATFITGSTK
ncbi:MAG: LytR C-terminal domain-containing protein [bacterium]|nr:LytR C-terminal domain-containing protein [bacterium]